MDARPSLDQIFGTTGSSPSAAPQASVAPANPSAGPVGGGRPSLDSIFTPSSAAALNNWQPPTTTSPNPNGPSSSAAPKLSILQRFVAGAAGDFAPAAASVIKAGEGIYGLAKSGVQRIAGDQAGSQKTLDETSTNLQTPVDFRKAVGVDDPNLAAISPIGYRNGQPLPLSKGLQDAAGNAATVASYLIGGGEGSEALKAANAAERVTQAAKVGAKVGALAGFGGGMKDEAGNNRDLVGQGTDIAFKTALGTGVGALLGLGTGVAGEGARFTKDAVSSLAEGNGIKTAASDATKSFRTPLEDRYIAQAKNDWQREAGNYVKSSKTLGRSSAQGKDDVSFLASRGITPRDIVVDGKYRPVESGVADRLMHEDTKPLESALQDSLKTAQEGHPPIKLADVQREALKSADAASNLTVGQKETIKAGIRREFQILGKNGETITLPDANDAKRTYWTNTKFDSTKPLQGDVHYHIGSAFKNAIEENVHDVNIKELNQLLGRYYSAGKFLNSFEGRVPKLTSGQKFARGVFKGVGTYMGDKLLGGMGGDVAGYFAGKSLANAFQDMSNPLKAYVLQHVEVEDPAILKQVSDYLQKTASEKAARLALPAPRSGTAAPVVGSEAGVIPMRGNVPYVGDRPFKK